MRTFLTLLLLLLSVQSWAGLMVDASSRNQPIKTITTDASVTPTTAHFTLSGGMNGVRVWTGEQSVAESYFDLYVSRSGGAAVKIRMFRWMGRIITGTSGQTFSFGTSDGRTMKFTPMYSPSTTETVTGVTATANCDKAGPPIWSPVAAHVTLPANARSFKISSNGTERDLFLREFDGYQWTPTRWVRIEASRDVTIRTSYRQVALANYAGSTVSVTAPAGSVIGGTMSTMSLTFPTITGTTRNVSTVAELKTAIGAAVAGDEIVLAAGTYALDVNLTEASFAANVAAGHKGIEGITIRGATGVAADVVITGSGSFGDWNLSQNGGPLSGGFKDLSFNFSGIPASLRLVGGTYKLENLLLSGPASDTRNIVTMDAGSGTALKLDAIWCVATNSSADVWNLHATSGDTNNTLVRLIGCNGSTAGANANDQCVTTHDGVTLQVYGGFFSDAAQNVFAHGVASDRIYAFFAATSYGARRGALLGSMLYGCSVLATNDAFGSSASSSSVYIEFTKISAPVAYTSSSSVIRNQAGGTIEHNVLDLGGGGRAFFNSINNCAANWNIITRSAEAFRMNNSSGAGTVTMIGNTCVNNTTAFSFGDPNLTELVTNNAAKISGTGMTCTVAESGRMGKSANVFDPTVSANYTPAANDVINADAALDANYFPTASGNCDGNGDESVVDFVGSSDPFGLVLIYKASRISRGAREIPAVYSGAELYPDLW